MVRYIQGTSLTATTNPVTVTMPQPIVTGNALLIGITTASQAVDVSGITDIANSSYSVQRTVNLGTTNMGLRIWAGIYATAASDGKVTISFTGTTTTNIFVYEYEGLSIRSVNFVDAITNGNEANGTSVTSDSITTSVDGELLFAVGGNRTAGVDLTVGAGYGHLATSTNGAALNGAVEDQIATTAGNYTASFGQTGSNNMGILLASFKPISYPPLVGFASATSAGF